MYPLEIAMNEKHLSVTLTGPIDTATVRLLANEVRLGFDYYQFSEMTLTLDSPGGEYNAMRSLLDIIHKRKAQNCHVHVQATQLCASAAALVLAHGQWGTRSVEPGTKLLFHWARASFKDGLTLTSDAAASLAQGLSTTDQRTLEHLVDCLCAGAGNAGKLVAEISSRLDGLLDDWGDIAAALGSDSDARAPKQIEWVKDLQRNLKRWLSEPSSVKQKAALVTTLKARFEKDSLMDLREAYALCLIDGVSGVLPRNAQVSMLGNQNPVTYLPRLG